MTTTSDSRESYLPTIKCSNCAAEVDFMAMADHVCTKTGLEGGLAKQEVPVDGGNAAGLSSKLKSTVQDVLRPRPPAIDPNIANRPFVSTEQRTPNSSSSSESNLSPSTPKDDEPLPSPLPSPDPSTATFSHATSTYSNNLTVSSQSSPYSLAGSSASNAPKSPLRYLMPVYSPRHGVSENANFAPASPGLHGPMLLKRMNTIAAGPFAPVPKNVQLAKRSGPQTPLVSLDMFDSLDVNAFEDGGSYGPLTVDLIHGNEARSTKETEPQPPAPISKTVEKSETNLTEQEAKHHDKHVLSTSPEGRMKESGTQRGERGSFEITEVAMTSLLHEQLPVPEMLTQSPRRLPTRDELMPGQASPRETYSDRNEVENLRVEQRLKLLPRGQDSKPQVVRELTRGPPMGLPKRPSEPTIALSNVNSTAAHNNLDGFGRPPLSMAHPLKRVPPSPGYLALNGRSIKRITPIGDLQTLPESPRLPINTRPPLKTRSNGDVGGRNLQMQPASSIGRSSPVNYPAGRTPPPNSQRPRPNHQLVDKWNVGPRENRSFAPPPPRTTSRARPLPPTTSETSPKPLSQITRKISPHRQTGEKVFNGVLNRIPTLFEDNQTPVKSVHGNEHRAGSDKSEKSMSDAAFTVLKIKSLTEKSARSTKEKSTCRICHLAIEGEKPIFSSDGKLSGKFHKRCFKCAHCTTPFYASTGTGEAVKGEQPSDFFVFEDAPYCPFDYHVRNNSLCPECKTGIEGQCRVVDYNSQQPKRYHLRCFCCAVPNCKADFEHGYYEIGAQRYCVKHAPSTKSARRFTRMMPFV